MSGIHVLDGFVSVLEDCGKILGFYRGGVFLPDKGDEKGFCKINRQFFGWHYTTEEKEARNMRSERRREA